MSSHQVESSSPLERPSIYTRSFSEGFPITQGKESPSGYNITREQQAPSKNNNNNINNKGNVVGDSKILNAQEPTFSKANNELDPLINRCSIAMLRTETVLVAASGDVMVNRCRKSSTPYIGQPMSEEMIEWNNMIACCDTDCMPIGQGDNPWGPVLENLSGYIQANNPIGKIKERTDQSTFDWEKIDIYQSLSDNALLGSSLVKSPSGRRRGSPGKDDESHTRLPAISPQPSPADYTESTVYDGGILPLPSFDYEHFKAGHNDMVPAKNEEPKPAKQSTSFLPIPEFITSEEKKSDDDHRKGHSRKYNSKPMFTHGVPTVLSSLSQIKIKMVSGHPLGAHVLLISAEALLFSYGLNNHGQLGIGVKSNVSGPDTGFIKTPTIITPLLENGGKAINCAAGINHSLVVVSTEGCRVSHVTNPARSINSCVSMSRVISSPSRLSPRGVDHDTFGKNSNDDSSSSVLHHQLYGFGRNDCFKIGLVGAHFGEDNSADDSDDILLPRRVALHCAVWPQQNSAQSTGKLPPQGIFQVAASVEHSVALVHRSTGDIEMYVWGNASAGALGLPDQSNNFGLTDQLTEPNVVFPLPTVLERLSYRPGNNVSKDFPVDVTLGPKCTFVVMASGDCYSFGSSTEGMLGQGPDVTLSPEPELVKFEGGLVAISAGAYHVVALTENLQAYSWGAQSNGRLGHGPHTDPYDMKRSGADQKYIVIEWIPRLIGLDEDIREGDKTEVVKICAGFDCSAVVLRSGRVLSFGKKSGRIGQGEVSGDVPNPEPMFGGLRLFYRRLGLNKK